MGNTVLWCLWRESFEISNKIQMSSHKTYNEAKCCDHTCSRRNKWNWTRCQEELTGWSEVSFPCPRDMGDPFFYFFFFSSKWGESYRHHLWLRERIHRWGAEPGDKKHCCTRTTEYLLPLNKVSYRNLQNVFLLEQVDSEALCGSREG